MLSLYKDPDGEGVFSAHDDPGKITTVHVPGGPPAQQSDLQVENDSLRKRVKQLEDAISEYQVNHTSTLQLLINFDSRVGLHCILYYIQKDLAANDGSTASMCNSTCSPTQNGDTVSTAEIKKE